MKLPLSKTKPITLVVIITSCCLSIVGCARVQSSIYDPGRSLEERHIRPLPQSCAIKQKAQLRRLNAREYVNSLKAVLGAAAVSETDLPRDQVNDADFDTDGSSLRLLPTDAERYYNAITKTLDAVTSSGSSAKLGCNLAQASSCLKSSVLSRLLTRVYRRPASDDDVQRFVEIAQNAPSTSEGVRLALTAALMSPRFLYLQIDDHEERAAGLNTHVLNAFELAERLSYMLWASPPDDELLQLAEDGELKNVTVLGEQIHRMIQDARFAGFVGGFVDHWLNLDKLKDESRDTKDFSQFSTALLADMKQESETFVRYVAQSERPLSDLLRADYSFLTPRLENLYSVSNPRRNGNSVEKVSLPSGERLGLLTQASVLTYTGNSTADSNPIIRGHWVTKKLLCREPPPPPNNVPTLEESTGGNTALTVKQKLAMHRSNPVCAGCHAEMDPIGVALENFDNIGTWRNRYADGSSVDASESYHGTRFNGPLELIDELDKGNSFKTCFSKQVLVYSMGRDLDGSESCLVNDVASQIGSSESRLEDLVQAIVTSAAFNKQAIN